MVECARNRLTCTCRQWWHNPSKKFLGRRKQIKKICERRVYEEMGGKEE
jgi:predicted ATPase